MSNLKIGIAPVVYTEGHKRLVCERQAVQLLLSELLGCEYLAQYAHHPSGAPYLIHLPNQYLSISHTEGLAMVGLNNHPIGVDIERISKQVCKVKSRFVHLAEEELLQSLNVDIAKALHILWTAKEAAYKLTNPPNGSLLSFSLPANITPLEQPNVLYLSDQYNSQLITIHYQVDEYYAQAIAYHRL